MNVLIFQPGTRHLRYACYSLGKAETRGNGLSRVVKDYRQGGDDQQVMAELVSEIWEEANKGGRIAAIAMEVAYGGLEFTGPAVVNDAVLERLGRIAGQSPLRLPVVISLARACRRVLPDVPVVLTFQTAFFADLPVREHSYGVAPELSDRLRLRRYGYYGLYHDSACSSLVHQHKDRGALRSISICLDNQTELAAVVGRRPVLVTSGATPLEGLPGRTTAGQLDPSIVLMLARKLKWGPEQINRMLTQQSGLLGMTGRRVTMQTLFASKSAAGQPSGCGELAQSETPPAVEPAVPGNHDGASPGLQLARHVMQYRILLACGSAVAAMGGLDEIVFSGRFAQAGRVLGPWLKEKLSAYRPLAAANWHIHDHSLERIMAELTSTSLAKPEDQAA